MSPKLVISPLLLAFLVAFLVAGELASGTSVYFAFMAALAVSCAFVTYNTLGGLGSISGIAFSRFALSTVIICQFCKVLVFERADEHLDVPQLTITVYGVYFFFLMLGTFVFSRLRLPLPKPAEPDTSTQSRYLYLLSFVGGVAGTLGQAALDLAGGAGALSLAHGFARALAYLLPFSLVLAVDARIRSTHGRHSVGWMAVWPMVSMFAMSFIFAARTAFLMPVAIVFLTCYVRGFKFGKRHVAAAIGVAVAFFLIVSPYYLYARGLTVHTTMAEQASAMVRSLETAPGEWETIKTTVGNAVLESPGAVNYFATPGAVTLNRFALIAPDSTLIYACSSGFHYGWESLREDFFSGIPRFLSPDKAAVGSGKYLGHLDGQEPDAIETTNSTITTISDSYGAFSWAGVAAFSFLVVPLIFVVYESIFDMRRPWGTVATALFLLQGTEGSMGHSILDMMIKDPAYVIIISWCVMWVVRMIPATGDRAVRLRAADGGAVATDALVASGD